jgi:hypothetical protein
MRPALLALILAAGPAAAAVDEFRVLKLEQDVHALQRDVQGLSREIAELRLQLAGPSGARTRRAPPPAAPEPGAWLDPENWQQVRPGMSALEVIGLLGTPTSTRTEDGARVMFYAMEIGSSGLLAGRVTLRDGRVTEVSEPALK